MPLPDIFSKDPTQSMLNGEWTPVRGAPFRPRSLVASVCFHLGIVVLLGASSSGPRRPSQPIREMIEANKNKIVYYNFKQKPVDVDARRRIGTLPTPRARQKAKQFVVARTPKPQSKRQTMLLPGAELQRDIPQPNLIARLNASLPALPAPPKEPPKPKVDDGVKAPQANASPREDKGAASKAPEANNDAVRVPKQARRFTPPPPPPRQPRLANPVIMVAPTPSAIAENPSMDLRLDTGAGIRAMSSAVAPPPSSAPPAPVANTGNSRTEVAIVNLNPTEGVKPDVTSGSRSGEFSKAPEVGPVSTGPVNPAGIREAGIAVREEGVKPPKVLGPLPNSRPVLYAERVRSMSPTTLSVPLRPSNRSLPRPVEAQFTGRNVYTLVIAIENWPAYAGDWVMWFAEKAAAPGLIRAPVPLRKLEPPDTPGERTALRIQVAATIGKDGKLDALSVLSKTTPAVEAAVLQDVVSWEFKPATRNALPIDVDIVFEIPFNLPAALTRN